jgi:hypothetical protein
MKISLMTNDQAADAMIKLAQPISNLMEDKETADLLNTLTNTQQEEGGIAYFGKVLPNIVSFCLKGHKQDVYAIVAALTLRPVGEVGKMNFLDTVKELRESIDEDFIGFFKPSGGVTNKPGM